MASSEVYKFRNLSYIAKHVRLPGESLQDFGAEVKKLTLKDKQDLDEWADTERALSA